MGGVTWVEAIVGFVFYCMGVCAQTHQQLVDFGPSQRSRSNCRRRSRRRYDDPDRRGLTDTAPTADAAHDPDSTRHDGAAGGLGGPRDRVSRGYGPRDDAEIRRRRRLKNAQSHAR